MAQKTFFSRAAAKQKARAKIDNMVAYSVFLAWTLSAIGAQPLASVSAPLLARMHESTLALYAGLSDNQRTVLHWALAFTAYAPLTLVYYVGVALLMPFLCAALLMAGAFMCDLTRTSALQALESVAPSLVPLVKRATARATNAQNAALLQIFATKVQQSGGIAMPEQEDNFSDEEESVSESVGQADETGAPSNALYE